MYKYIYIYIYMYLRRGQALGGTKYLSSATCLARPRFFCALLAVLCHAMPCSTIT